MFKYNLRAMETSKHIIIQKAFKRRVFYIFFNSTSLVEVKLIETLLMYNTERQLFNVLGQKNTLKVLI